MDISNDGKMPSGYEIDYTRNYFLITSCVQTKLQNYSISKWELLNPLIFPIIKSRDFAEAVWSTVV